MFPAVVPMPVRECWSTPRSGIFRVSPSGDWTLVAEYDGMPNGLKFHRDGRAFVADLQSAGS